MITNLELNTGWSILQDVHDLGEKLRLWSPNFENDRCSHLISGWENLDRLAALQIVFSQTPYYGRELRSFNTAPWWYKNEFEYHKKSNEIVTLKFTSVDYYAKVYLNGEYIGSHEGYFDPFEFEITDSLQEKNILFVKVWAPWDNEILDKAEAMRVYSIKREMIKGTYEHADGFIQRDVNPVGILGPVVLKGRIGSNISDDTFFTATLNNGLDYGTVKVDGRIYSQIDNGKINLTLLDKYFNVVGVSSIPVSTDFSISINIEKPHLWNVWERGEQYLYISRLEVIDSQGIVLDEKEEKLGFRTISLYRDINKTEFSLNGKRIYLRGTSYFPDVYLSEMNRDRYFRDLVLIKSLGFNSVRVHVHVENKDFYDLCDELGLLVIQDSDFNWDHPTTEEWVRNAKNIFGRMIDTLKSHPSIICWVVLNEPDVWKIFTDGLIEQTKEDEIMLESLCNYLLAELKERDSSRPYIKASREESDIESGDTHTYIGSLATGTNYYDIANTSEKLNSEFGMDIPSDEISLFKDRRIFNRLKPIIPKIKELQKYQYKLIKYYIEHYRAQKYKPNSGYFQFMFIDLCPQSFYGIVDYYGIPKEGYYACLESNGIVSVMARKMEDGFKILIANDGLKTIKGKVLCSIISDNQLIDFKEIDALSPCDSLVEIGNIESLPECCDIFLSFVDESNSVVSENKYIDAFKEIEHIKGHSLELDNELGMRLFMEKGEDGKYR